MSSPALAQPALMAQRKGPSVAASEFRVVDAHQYDYRSPGRWIVSHLVRRPLLPLVFVLSAIGMALLQSRGAVLTGEAFDAIVGDKGVAAFLTVVLLILAVRLSFGLIDLVNSFLAQWLAQLIERDAREELYVSLLGKSLTFHNQQRVGDIMARATNDVQQLNAMLTPGASLIIESLISIVVPLIIIGTLNPQLLLMPLLFLVSFVVALRHYSAQLQPVAGALRGQFGTMNARLAEAISGIEVVKGYAQEAQEQARFEANAQRYRDLFVREGGVQARYLPLLLYGVLVGLGFAHAAWLLIQGQLTVGEVIAYMGLLEILRFPTFISTFTFALVALGFAGARRILQTITTETELDENVGGHRATIAGAIRFADVDFGYETAAQPPPWPGAPEIPARVVPVLCGVSFAAAPGQTIAVVGQTGAGKTTLTRLINRTYDARAGVVSIDGIDVRTWNLDSLRSQISTIEQDIFLFSRSIADNIAFGVPGVADRAAIEAAARQAQAHEFIMALPEGYDTVIGERGVTLSGGQRQRIAIARAFLSDPRILILDDSTSAIDSATEDEIQQAMRQIMRGRTTVLITHRVSQIRWADRILVLKNGELIAQGTHDELISQSAAYRRIFVRLEEPEQGATTWAL
jgi:ATP-binding cassette subfamily B protein